MPNIRIEQAQRSERTRTTFVLCMLLLTTASVPWATKEYRFPRKEGLSLYEQECLSLYKTGLFLQKPDDLTLQEPEGLSLQEREGLSPQEPEGLFLHEPEKLTLQEPEGLTLQKTKRRCNLESLSQRVARLKQFGDLSYQFGIPNVERNFCS